MKHYYAKIDPLDSLKVPSKCSALNKVDCFYLHKQIKEQFDGIHESLTWDTGLVFNCDFYSHEDLYNNLFKLKYNGTQLGQEG